MELIPEWAPNVHPIIVHFPIGILLVAAFLDLLNFSLPDEWWDDLKSTILYGIGAVSAIAAYYTGSWAADSIFLPSGAQTVLNNHADWALWTVWFFGLYALLRIAFHWLDIMEKKSLRYVAFITVLPGLFLLYETGEHGAKMVFGYGTGTGQLLEQHESERLPTDSLSTQNLSSFQIDEENWSWEISANGVSAFLQNFYWLEGAPQNLNPSILKNGNNHLLRLSGDSLSSFFATHANYQNVQVDYYLDLSGFNGEVELANHVQDTQNYDFTSLVFDGSITQGRVSDGETELFAEKEYSASGMMFVRVVGNGTHFRAYINKEIAVHGHGDAPEAGSIGIKLQGSGTILIDKIELTKLN